MRWAISLKPGTRREEVDFEAALAQICAQAGVAPHGGYIARHVWSGSAIASPHSLFEGSMDAPPDGAEAIWLMEEDAWGVNLELVYLGCGEDLAAFPWDRPARPAPIAQPRVRLRPAPACAGIYVFGLDEPRTEPSLPLFELRAAVRRYVGVVRKILAIVRVHPSAMRAIIDTNCATIRHQPTACHVVLACAGPEWLGTYLDAVRAECGVRDVEPPCDAITAAVEAAGPPDLIGDDAMFAEWVRMYVAGRD